jgi:hypothetical protein
MVQESPKTARLSVAAMVLRFERRPDGQQGPRFRVLAGGGVPGSKEVDLSIELTGAIAHAIWRVRGGDSLRNWVDAEMLVDQIALAGGAKRSEPEAAHAPATKPADAWPATGAGKPRKFDRR